LTDAPAETMAQVIERAHTMDAPLNARLQLIADGVRAHHPASAEIMDRLVSRLSQAGVGAGAPAVGDVLPPFVLPDEQGRLLRLEDLLQGGPVVVAFHRGHWCPYCRLGVGALAAIQDRLGGTQLVAISPEIRTFASQLKAQTGAAFPFLTDMDCGYALSLDLAVWLGDEVADLMVRSGTDLPAFQGSKAWVLPIPAAFVVGRDGRIIARHVDPDFRRRMEIDTLLQALDVARG